MKSRRTVFTLALLRRRTKEEWAEKHRNVAKKFGFGRRMGAETTFRYWKGERNYMSSMPQRRGHGEAQAIPLPKQERSHTTDPRDLQKVGAASEEWKWQGVMTYPTCESQWKRDHFSVKSWESEKHKSWGLPAEGFQGHVATDGSFLGVAGK